MARISDKVKSWSPQKGKTKGLRSTYDAYCGNKDTLFDIHCTHKSWGDDWYELVRCGSYENAKAVLIAEKKAQGFSFIVAIRCIDDLAALEEEMDKLEQGGIR